MTSIPLRLAAAVASAGLLLAATTSAQSQEDYKKLRDKKLAKHFLKNGKWFTNYEEALAEARKTNKLIFGYFTRSFAP